MTDDEIKALALQCGFTERQQHDGSMNLSPYVYQFARQLLESNTNRCAAIARQMNAPQVAGAIEGVIKNG